MTPSPELKRSPTKKVAVIQSNYIPWKGYFDIIHDVDLFIFYDDVQYSKNDWRNRNRIKTAQGLHWLTIPVGSPEHRLICDIEPANDLWPRKHWATIQQSYVRSPHFSRYQSYFEHVYTQAQWTNLSALNQSLIQTISTDFLGIHTEFKDSREFRPTGQKAGRLLDLLRKAGATSYLSGPSAKDYLDERDFVDAGIELVYKDYSGYPEYTQPFPPFVHTVSVIDLLFNCGPESPDSIWGWRARA